MSLLRVLLGVIILSLLMARPVSGVGALPADPVFSTISVLEGGAL